MCAYYVHRVIHVPVQLEKCTSATCIGGLLHTTVPVYVHGTVAWVWLRCHRRGPGRRRDGSVQVQGNLLGPKIHIVLLHNWCPAPLSIHSQLTVVRHVLRQRRSLAGRESSRTLALRRLTLCTRPRSVRSRDARCASFIMSYTYLSGGTCTL